MARADTAKAIRSEPSSANALETGRASMMPSVIPAITVPTTRPRCASGARRAEYGISTCTVTEPTPVRKAQARNTGALVARASPHSPQKATASSASTRRRFSTKSPSGAASGPASGCA